MLKFPQSQPIIFRKFEVLISTGSMSEVLTKIEKLRPNLSPAEGDRRLVNAVVGSIAESMLQPSMVSGDGNSEGILLPSHPHAKIDEIFKTRGSLYSNPPASAANVCHLSLIGFIGTFEIEMT